MPAWAVVNVVSSPEDREQYAAEVAAGLEHIDQLSRSGVISPETAEGIKVFVFDSAARMNRDAAILADAHAVLFGDDLGTLASVLLDRLTPDRTADLGGFLVAAGNLRIEQQGGRKTPPARWRFPSPDGDIVWPAPPEESDPGE